MSTGQVQALKAKDIKIVFDGFDKSLIPLIKKDVLQKIPPKAFHMIRSNAIIEDLDEMDIYRFKQSRYVEVIPRVIQFAAHSDYVPTLTNTPLEVIDPDTGKPIVYNPQLHNNGTIIAAARSAHELLLKELEVYAFSCLTEFHTLSERCSLRLRTLYPFYEAEMRATVKYLANVQNIVIDDQLRTFLQRHFDIHRAALIEDTPVLEALRKSTNVDDHIAAICRRFPEGPKRQMHEIMLNSIPAAQQYESFFRCRLGVKEDAVTGGTMKAKAQAVGPADEIGTIFSALHQERLLVAMRDGEGTWRANANGDHPTRTRDHTFRFLKNEILVVDPSPGWMLNDPHKTYVVRNFRGDIGEVRRGQDFMLVQDCIENRNQARMIDGPRRKKAKGW